MNEKKFVWFWCALAVSLLLIAGFACGVIATVSAAGDRRSETSSVTKLTSIPMLSQELRSVTCGEYRLLSEPLRVADCSKYSINFRTDTPHPLDPPFVANVNLNASSPLKDNYPTILQDHASGNLWAFYQHENTSANEHDICVGVSINGGRTWRTISLGNLQFHNQTGATWWANDTIQPTADIDGGMIWFSFVDTKLKDWLFYGQYDAATGQLQNLGAWILELHSSRNPNWQWNLTNVETPTLGVAGQHIWIGFVADVNNRSAGTTWTGPITDSWGVAASDNGGTNWGFGMATPSAPPFYDFTLSHPSIALANSATQENLYYSWQGRGDRIVQGGNSNYQAIFFGWWNFLNTASGDEAAMGGQNFNVRYPAIAASQDYGYVVVQADAGGNDNIVLTYTTHGGNSASTDWQTGNVVTTPNPERYPAVSANPLSGGEVAVVYISQNAINYINSTNNGAAWGTALRISDNTPGTAIAEYHTGSIFASQFFQPFVLWSDSRSGSGDIYFSTFTVAGRDLTPPGQIADLSVLGTPTSTRVNLTWTAPADNDTDPASGPVRGYEVRYLAGTTPIDESNWNTAIVFPSPPAPAQPYQTQWCNVTGLTPDTNYYFAVKAFDEVPNWSPVSNSVAARTAPAVGPTLTVSVTANPNTINAGESATIRAFVTVGATPVSGASCTGTLSPSQGTISAFTDIGNGNYTATYNAPATVLTQIQVTVTVRASKTGYTDGTGSTRVTVNPSPQYQLAVTLTPNPASIYAGSTSTITIRVTNQSSGAGVTGATIEGYVSPTGFGTLDTAIPGNDGFYNMTYRAPASVSSTTTVTINVNATKAGYAKGTNRCSVTVTPAPQYRLGVSVELSQIAINAGSSSTVTAHVTNISSGQPVTGAVVTGMLSPNIGTLGTFNEAGAGDYTATYTAPSTIASSTQITITVNASKTGFINGTGSSILTVNPGQWPTLGVTVSSDKRIIASGGQASLTITVKNGTQAVAGANVVMASSKGGTFSPSTGTTNSEGVFTCTFNAPAVSVTTTLRIYANASKPNFNSGSGKLDLTINKPGTPTLTVTIVAGQTTISSGSQTTITVTVKNGTQPVSGANVYLTSDKGGTFTQSSGTTDANGKFTSTFTAPLVTQPATIKITAVASMSGYNDGTAAVSITANPPVSRGSIAGKVVDEKNNPLEGVTIDAKNATGALVKSTNTDSNGEFNLTDMPYGIYTLWINKTGYKTYQYQVSLNMPYLRLTTPIQLTKTTTTGDGVGPGGGLDYWWIIVVIVVIVVVLVVMLMLIRKKKAAAAPPAQPPAYPPPAQPPVYPPPAQPPVYPPPAQPPAYPPPAQPPAYPPPTAYQPAPTPPEEPVGKRCPSCGNLNHTWVTNCAWCGAPL